MFFLEQFTYVKRGYDPEEVDRYISTLEQVVKSYKEKDNAIKNAIISAQIAADNMVKNAKAQADEYKGQIGKELDKVTDEVNRQRVKIQAFQDVYAGLVRKYLTDIDDKEISELYSRLDDIDKMIVRLKETDIVPPVSPLDMSHPKPSAPAPSAPTPPAPAFVSGLPPQPPKPQPPQIPKPPAPQPQHQAPPVPPQKSPVPTISLDPNNAPSLNKNPMQPNPPSGDYAPPQVVAKFNDEGNYVPRS